MHRKELTVPGMQLEEPLDRVKYSRRGGEQGICNCCHLLRKKCQKLKC